MINGMPHHLVEWFRTEADQARIAQITEALTAGVYPAEVTLVLIIAVPTDQVVYGLFAASSSEALLALCARAGIPPQRVSADVHHAVHRAAS